MRTSPCKGCLSRTVGCHSCCEKYKTWCADRAKWVEAQRRASEVTSVIIDGRNRMMITSQGGKRRRPSCHLKGESET